MPIFSKLKNLLLEAGLSEIEAQVYLDLLAKPAQTIWELVQRTGFSKNAVYRAFEKLKNLKIVEKNIHGLQALSLKSFVADLNTSKRDLTQLIYKFKQIAPFLHAPQESVEEFETFYTPEQIAQAYLFMSEIDYSVCFDFGDFESFLPKLGGIDLAHQFIKNRIKKAKSEALCTSSGPYTTYFMTRKHQEKYKARVNILDMHFKNNHIVFSDTNDYVLFNNVIDGESLRSTLVKSKVIADAQRMYFNNLSQQFGKN